MTNSKENRILHLIVPFSILSFLINVYTPMIATTLRHYSQIALPQWRVLSRPSDEGTQATLYIKGILLAIY